MAKFFIDLERIKWYDQIVILTQKRRDIDTVAGAAAIATILKRKLPDKRIYIVGNHKGNHRVPEAREFSGYRKGTKGTKLAILSEITFMDEVEDIGILDECDAIISFNHHDPKPIGDAKVLFHQKEYIEKILVDWNLPEAPSVCCVIWKWITDSDWRVDAALASIIFRGIYADTNGFATNQVNTKLLELITLLSRLGVDIPKEILRCQRMDYRFNQVYASAIKKSEFKDGILFINFVPDFVKAAFPYLIRYNKKERTVRIFKTRLFTFVFRKAVNEVDANTVVFVHYSRFNPFYNPNKMVYIALNKENQQLEELLKRFKFKQSREGNNIFTRIMNYTDLTNMISQNYSTFVGDYAGFEEEEQDQEE